ncbi:hypothetical protein AOLI_G00073810 [Acnodon oligacanthus]
MSVRLPARTLKKQTKTAQQQGTLSVRLTKARRNEAILIPSVTNRLLQSCRGAKTRRIVENSFLQRQHGEQSCERRERLRAADHLQHWCLYCNRSL